MPFLLRPHDQCKESYLFCLKSRSNSSSLDFTYIKINLGFFSSSMKLSGTHCSQYPSAPLQAKSTILVSFFMSVIKQRTVFISIHSLSTALQSCLYCTWLFQTKGPVFFFSLLCTFCTVTFC